MNKKYIRILIYIDRNNKCNLFHILRGPNANLTLSISVFTVLSVLGIIFAIVSRKLWFVITGIILNGAVLIFAYFLLLAAGISEP